MLGEKLGEIRGRVTGQRILPPAGESPRIETTFEVGGTLAGVEVRMLGTYWTEVRPDGSLYGECPQGLLMTRDGEVGTWTGTGAGRFTGEGSGARFRGSIHIRRVPPSLARLAGTAILHEWEVDGEGNAGTALWEWK